MTAVCKRILLRGRGRKRCGSPGRSVRRAVERDPSSTVAFERKKEKKTRFEMGVSRAAEGLTFEIFSREDLT